MKDEPGLVEKKMFGGVGFMLNGNMACGVNKEDLIARIGPEKYEQGLTHPHVRPFDFTGRPMKGWVMVGPDGVSTDDDLQDWVGQGDKFHPLTPIKIVHLTQACFLL